jgi:large subunit ribosomal protein L10e
MARKPGSIYRYVLGQLTTRKEYMGGIPNLRITQFIMGNKTADFPVCVKLIALEQCQARHTSLEASRISGNRSMEKKAGQTNYRMRVRVYPHVILRENKQATGAGADRVSQGMRASFGKIVSTAARIKPNQTVIEIFTYPQFIKAAKESLRKAGMKIPSPCHVVVEGEN